MMHDIKLIVLPCYQAFRPTPYYHQLKIPIWFHRYS